MTELPRAELPNPKFNAADKAPAVRAMFAEIAPSYDRLNHLLSLNIDKRWRRFTVDQLKDVLQRPDALALDLCCGTADLTLELAQHARVFERDREVQRRLTADCREERVRAFATNYFCY